MTSLPPTTVTVPPVVDPRLPSIGLALTVDPSPITVGETATLTLTLTNQAPSPATDLVITIAPPPDTVLEPGDGFVSSTQGWRWTRARLAGESSLSVTATVRVPRLPVSETLLTQAMVQAAQLTVPLCTSGGALVEDRTRGPGVARFRRLTRDYERTATVLAGWHVLAFAMILLKMILLKRFITRMAEVERA